MAILKNIMSANKPNKLLRMLNWYGPYFGAGIKVEYLADDWKELTVAMHMKWYNRNAVGTHFGGSLYAMIDPHYMLMLMKLLGQGYTVWDKAAHIDFIKPGTGTVRANMTITDAMLNEIYKHTEQGKKYLPEFKVEIIDQQGEVVARAIKTLYVRKKNHTNQVD